MLQQVHMPRPLSLGCKPWRRRCPMQPRWLQRLHAPAPPLQLASGRGGAMVAKSLPASTGKPSCSRRDQWLTCNQGAGGKKPKCSAGQRVEGAGGLPNLQAAEAKLVARNCTAGSCAPMRACLVGGQEVAGPAVAPAAERLQPLVLKHLLYHLDRQGRKQVGMLGKAKPGRRWHVQQQVMCTTDRRAFLPTAWTHKVAGRAQQAWLRLVAVTKLAAHAQPVSSPPCWPAQVAGGRAWRDGSRAAPPWGCVAGWGRCRVVCCDCNSIRSHLYAREAQRIGPKWMMQEACPTRTCNNQARPPEHLVWEGAAGRPTL